MLFLHSSLGTFANAKTGATIILLNSFILPELDHTNEVSRMS